MDNKNFSKKRSKFKQYSFTLIELLLVLGIIMILAGIFMPNFGKAKERALQNEARANLKLIAAAERIYRMEVNPTSYYPFSGSQSNPTTINNDLKLFIREDNWDYAIAVKGSSTNPSAGFSATATRSATGCVYTLDYDDANGEPDKNASCK